MGSTEFGDTGHALVVEEYRSLREEILQRQQARMSMLLLYSGAISIGVGFAFAESASPIQRSVIIGSLMTLGFIILQDMIHNTRQIARIGSYIKVNIESRYDGPRWERAWIAHSRGSSAVMTNSKVYALVLGAYAVALAGLSLAYDGVASIRFVFVPVLAALMLLRCADVWIRWSGAWVIDEELLRDPE